MFSPNPLQALSAGTKCLISARISLEKPKKFHSMSVIPATQKALSIPAKGLSYSLTTRHVPRPGPGQVLIKLEALGLNPAEWKYLKMDFPSFMKALGIDTTYPAMMGQDGAGTVVAVGDGVKGVTLGDRVTFQGWFEHDLSAYQQYTLAHADLVAKIPSSMSFLDAASIPLALATAAFGFALPSSEIGGLGLKGFWEDDAEGFYQGQTMLIFGGSSSVGQYAIQIARYLGFSTIITTSSVKHTEFFHELGATHVLDRKADVAAQIKHLVGDSGFPYIYDAVHDPITQTEVDFLAPGGTMVTGQRSQESESIAGPKGDLSVGLRAPSQGYWQEIVREAEFLQKGIIKPNRVEKIPGGLSGVVGGLQRLEAGQVSGHKLVVVPSETASAQEAA